MSDPKKILIVDDDESTLSMYAEVFSQAGFSVIEAADGLEGLDKAIQDSPAVIFTGIIMPKMDGFSLVEALKKNVATSNIPVVMCSHMGREEDRQRAKEMGVKEFIIRDITTPKEVVNKIVSLWAPKEYFLKFNTSESDAPILAKELGISPSFDCKTCGQPMVIKMKTFDASNGEFSARIVCPRCG